MRGAAMVAALLLAGCAEFRPPAPGAGASHTGPAAAAGAAAPGTGCADDAVIEDAEDGDNQVLLRGGRSGYLYTYRDGHGSSVAPEGKFATSSGGAEGTHQALRMHGKLADRDDAYAGVGLSFTDPKAPYDASRWKGLVFYARAAPGSATSVRLKVPDASTDPDGHVCKECFNDFGIDFQVTDEWTRYEVAFADLKQGAGWGAPRPDAIDLTRLYSLQWQVTTRNASFDVWIDEISFLCR
jgi:endoglucanase